MITESKIRLSRPPRRRDVWKEIAGPMAIGVLSCGFVEIFGSPGVATVVLCVMCCLVGYWSGSETRTCEPS